MVLPMVVVTLPTVCLLWFMSQAVRNERLAVKQKLADAYSRTLTDVRSKTERKWAAVLDLIVKDLPTEPGAVFKAVMSCPQDPNDPGHPLCVQALTVFGRSGQILYPRPSEPRLSEGQAVDRSGIFEKAWEAEYVLNSPSEAATQYQQLAAKSQDAGVQVTATMGAVRCLSKIGQVQQAVALAEQMLAERQSLESPALRASRFNLRIQIIQILRDAHLPQYAQKTGELLREALDYQDLSLPSEVRAFVLAKAVEFAQQDPAPGPTAQQIRTAEILRKAEVLSLQVVEQVAAVEGMAGEFQGIRQLAAPAGQVRRLAASGLFVCVAQHRDLRLLLAFDKERLTQCLARLIRRDLAESLGFRFVDEKGQPDQEIDQDAAVLGSYPLGSFLPSWGIEVFLRGDSMFDEAARRQQTLYIWTGTLVIVLIVLAAAFATQMIHRQMRLNRLKNNFIATVTHELKTPLASMRVLVDTLLDGHTKDDRQVLDYLNLIAKENVRLTALIDNFLTFSRMERNKQAFVIGPTDTMAILRVAAEAVRTRFEMADCRFDTQVEDRLPRVLADHDAVVTVLVNLLDNACKYTGDRKEITLRVWADGPWVCFSVSDNGVGIPKRAIRRIFDKFYQVDRSLSRKAGGCGLGLAIVKFIVDAHRGTVTVDSRVDQGSTFTVRLPKG